LVVVESKPGVIRVISAGSAERIVSIGVRESIPVYPLWNSAVEYLYLYESELSKLVQIAITVERANKLQLDLKSVVLESSAKFTPASLGWRSEKIGPVNTQFLRRFGNHYYFGWGLIVDPINFRIFSPQKIQIPTVDELLQLGELRERARWYRDLEQSDLAADILAQITQLEQKFGVSKFFNHNESTPNQIGGVKIE
jgi:hypothetical protein